MQKPHPIHSSSLTVFLAQTWACLILCTYYFCPNKFASCHCSRHLVPFLLVLYDLDIHDEELASRETILADWIQEKKYEILNHIEQIFFPQMCFLFYFLKQGKSRVCAIYNTAKPNVIDHNQWYMLFPYCIYIWEYMILSFPFIKEIEYFFANIAIQGCPSTCKATHSTKWGIKVENSKPRKNSVPFQWTKEEWKEAEGEFEEEPVRVFS